MKIKCIGCGKEKEARKDVVKKRIAKFGSLEKLRAGYKCRDCRKTSKPTTVTIGGK